MLDKELEKCYCDRELYKERSERMEKVKVVSRIERERGEILLAEMPIWVHNALVLLGWKFYWN